VHVGDGTSPYLYSLAPKGKERVTAKGNGVDTVPTVRVRLSEHAERITDFRIALLLGLRKVAGSILTTWRQDRLLRFSGTVRVGNQTKPVPIIPDAFFILNAGGRDYAYFLEIDRGTTDLARIRTKFLAYLDLWQSKAAQVQLGIRSFRVLYVTTTEHRLVSMVKVVEALQSVPDRRDILNLLTFEQFSLARPEKLFEAIWTTVQTNGKADIAKPLPGLLPSTFLIAPAKPAVREPDTGAS
jgi:hypothetical protein